MAVSARRLRKTSTLCRTQDFILGYENGRVGCCVSTFLILRLFFVGKIREKKVSANLLFWSLAFLALITLSVVGFLKLPVLLALLGTIAILAIYILLFFYWVGEIAVSAALANPEFYEFVMAKRALWIYADEENNVTKPQRVMLMRRAPLAQHSGRLPNTDSRPARRHPPTQ